MTAVTGTARANVRHNRIELITGIIVLAGLAVLLLVAMIGRQQHGSDGYPVRASFSQIDGLNVGADVRLAGITIGHVTAESVDARSFQAQVTFSVSPRVKLPTDSAAIITSDSLLGGKYIALSPGGADSVIKSGGVINDTQGSISLEQLLSKFIFSVTDALQRSKRTSGGGTSDQP